MIQRTPEERRQAEDAAAGSWPEYRRLVISELERLNETLVNIQKEFAKVRTEVELLKLKASVWGVAAGAISGTVVTVGAILLRGGIN